MSGTHACIEPSKRGPVVFALSDDDRRAVTDWLHGDDEPGALLPQALLRSISLVRDESCSAGCIRSVPVDDDAIESTPMHWKEAGGQARRYDRLLLELAKQLGTPFAWPTLQGGAIVQNVVPMASHAHLQSGHGSVTELYWHTEDAFAATPPEYVLLLCLRNDERAATTFASFEDVPLDTAQFDTLAQPRFIVTPDPVHLTTDVRAARAAGLLDGPQTMPILFGDRRNPYLRLDPCFTSVASGDEDAAAALAALRSHLEAALHPVVLEAGDLLVIDNLRAVHGRASFDAQNDGHGRWLKKVIVRGARSGRATGTDRGRR